MENVFRSRLLFILRPAASDPVRAALRRLSAPAPHLHVLNYGALLKRPTPARFFKGTPDAASELLTELFHTGWEHDPADRERFFSNFCTINVTVVAHPHPTGKIKTVVN